MASKRKAPPDTSALRGKRATARRSVVDPPKRAKSGFNMPPRITKKDAAEFIRRATMSHVLQRFEFLQKAGLQFGGKRDIWETAGYEKQPSFDHYWSLYKRDAIGGRIVDMAPKTTWRTPPAIVEEGEEETAFTKAFDELATRLKLWRYFERVDRLSGVGRYGILLIGTRGGEDLKRPLKKLQGPDSIIYLQAYHEGNAQINTWVTSTSDPRFGQPETYKVTLTSGVDNFRPSGATADLIVHWSRIIHVAEDLLEDEVFGRPRLERALNRLADLDKIAASTGEAYWQAVVRILTANVAPEAEISPEDLKKLDERLLEMTHDLRRQFTGQGVKLEWLPSDVPTVKDIGDFYFSLIAGAVGIPQRILFGSEMGELASSTDQQTWFGLINERQEQFAEPSILRAFVDRMIEFNALPPATSGEYQVQWPTLFQETDTEKADLNLKRAQQAQMLTPVGGDPRIMVTIDDEGTIQLIPQDEDQAQEIADELRLGLPGDDVLPEPPGATGPTATGPTATGPSGVADDEGATATGPTGPNAP